MNDSKQNQELLQEIVFIHVSVGLYVKYVKKTPIFANVQKQQQKQKNGLLKEMKSQSL